MIREVFMPALSSTMTEGIIVSWTKSPGDKVEKGVTGVIVESDKADMDVESFYEGYLATIIVDAGDVAQVGNAIALLAESEAEIAEAQAQAQTQESAGSSPASAPEVAAVTASSAASAPVPVSQNGAAKPSGRVIVSPRARKLAKTLKIDISGIQGSGPHGRIVAQDIEQAAGQVPTAPVA